MWLYALALADLEHDKILAREHHQYGVAKACSELQGRYLAMFTDKMQTEITEVRTYNAKELKMLVMEGERRDKRISEAGSGIVE